MQARTRRTSMAAALLLLAALVTLPAVASIEKAAPEEVGLSADRLNAFTRRSSGTSKAATSQAR